MLCILYSPKIQSTQIYDGTPISLSTRRTLSIHHTLHNNKQSNSKWCLYQRSSYGLDHINPPFPALYSSSLGRYQGEQKASFLLLGLERGPHLFHFPETKKKIEEKKKTNTIQKADIFFSKMRRSTGGIPGWQRRSGAPPHMYSNSPEVKALSNSVSPTHPQANSAIRRVQSAAALGSLQSSRSTAQISELQLVSAKLREMQLEISRLNRKIKESESEEQRTNAFARRSVLICNILLAVLTFVNRTSFFFRSRTRLTGFMKRFLVPHAFASKQTLSAFLYDAILNGAKSSVPFLVGYGFLVSYQGRFCFVFAIFSLSTPPSPPPPPPPLSLSLCLSFTAPQIVITRIYLLPNRL